MAIRVFPSALLAALASVLSLPAACATENSAATVPAKAQATAASSMNSSPAPTQRAPKAKAKLIGVAPAAGEPADKPKDGAPKTKSNIKND